MSTTRWRILPTALWFLLYAWRPWWLGFYHDDWFLTLPRSPSASIFAQIYDTDSSRPMAVLVRWCIHGLVGQDPFGWQLSIVAVSLAAALTLALLARCLLRGMGYDDLSAGRAAGIAAATYLTFPWLLGTAWVTGSMYTWATLGINLAYITWFAPWPIWQRCVVTSTCFVGASLITEVYWLSFVPFAALVTLCCTSISRRDLAWMTGTLAATQLGLIMFNRAIAAWHIGVNKTFDPNWLSTLVFGDKHGFVIGMDHIFGRSGVAVLTILLGVLLAAAVVRWRSHRAAAILVPATLGIAFSHLLFAMAGYALQLTGLFARTSVGSSWWLTIALAPTVAAICELPRPWAMITNVAWALMTALLAYGTLTQTGDWVASWQQQVEILGRMPRVALLAAPSSSVLVVEISKQTGQVGTFQAPWDISSAIWTVAPDIARHLSGSGSVGSQFAIPVTESGYWRIRATPTNVTQTQCADPKAAPIFELKGSNVLIWKVSDGKVEVVSSPIELGCSPAI